MSHMIDLRIRGLALISVAVGLLGTSCAANTHDDSSSSSAAEELFSLDLGHGRSIEFYEHPSALFVVERNPSNTVSPLTELGLEHASFPEIYAALRPSEAIPFRLISAEEHLRKKAGEIGDEDASDADDKPLASISEPQAAAAHDGVAVSAAALTVGEFLNAGGCSCALTSVFNLCRTDPLTGDFFAQAKSKFASFSVNDEAGNGFLLNSFISGNPSGVFTVQAGQMFSVRSRGPKDAFGTTLARTMRFEIAGANDDLYDVGGCWTN